MRRQVHSPRHFTRTQSNSHTNTHTHTCATHVQAISYRTCTATSADISLTHNRTHTRLCDARAGNKLQDVHSHIRRHFAHTIEHTHTHTHTHTPVRRTCRQQVTGRAQPHPQTFHSHTIEHTHTHTHACATHVQATSYRTCTATSAAGLATLPV